jgi:16S rRNA G527 N7-methylase RsmG
MKRLVIVCCCVSALAMTGCGSNPDALVKEQIQIMNEMATALENNAPQSKLDALQDRNNKLNKKFEALNLSTEEKRKLLERHKGELVPATERLQKAMMSRAMKDIGGGFPGMPGLGGKP